ncbi:ribonuclease H-like domain-containing protein [Tanacetum coccineum]
MFVHNSKNDDDYVEDTVTLISKLDISDPLHLHPNYTTSLTIVSIKFKRIENYQVWSCAMLLALEGKNKIGFIDGTCKRSNTDEQNDAMIELPKCVCNASESSKKHNQLLKLMQFFMALDDSYMQIRSSILSTEVLPDVRSAYATIFSEESHRVASRSIYDWHCKLGHLAKPVLNVLKGSLQIDNNDKNICCELCQRAKQTRESFPLSDHVSSCLGELVHLDLWGPYKSASSSSAESGRNSSTADSSVNSENDADNSHNSFSTQDEGVTTLEENIYTEGVFLTFLVYVDDIIITGNNVSEIENFKVFLKSKFMIKDLGKLKYFLGIEVIDIEKGICLNQRKYVLDLLFECGMLACKPVNTPLVSKLVISNKATKKDLVLKNITDYPKLMGN